jgi:hypothetical protein
VDSFGERNDDLTTPPSSPAIWCPELTWRELQLAASASADVRLHWTKGEHIGWKPMLQAEARATKASSEGTGLD